MTPTASHNIAQRRCSESHPRNPKIETSTPPPPVAADCNSDIRASADASLELCKVASTKMQRTPRLPPSQSFQRPNPPETTARLKAAVQSPSATPASGVGNA